MGARSDKKPQHLGSCNAPDWKIWGETRVCSHQPSELDHPEKGGDQTRQTGSFVAEQGGKDTASRTGSSGVMWPYARDRIIRGRSTRRSNQPQGLDHPGTSGGMAFRTGTSEAEQEGAAITTRRGTPTEI